MCAAQPFPLHKDVLGQDQSNRRNPYQRLFVKIPISNLSGSIIIWKITPAIWKGSFVPLLLLHKDVLSTRANHRRLQRARDQRARQGAAYLIRWKGASGYSAIMMPRARSGKGRHRDSSEIGFWGEEGVQRSDQLAFNVSRSGLHLHIWDLSGAAAGYSASGTQCPYFQLLGFCLSWIFIWPNGAKSLIGSEFRAPFVPISSELKNSFY